MESGSNFGRSVVLGGALRFDFFFIYFFIFYLISAVNLRLVLITESGLHQIFHVLAFSLERMRKFIN